MLNESNYFKVGNKYLAMGIAYVTQERFYKFDDNGKEIYVFYKNDNIIDAHRILKNLKYKDI